MKLLVSRGFGPTWLARACSQAVLGTGVVLELFTVTDTEAVAFDGPTERRYEDLEPDTDYTYDGLTWRTLPPAPGHLLATLATVNDTHFGELECGVIGGTQIGPILRSEPGATPYPVVMNTAAAAEIAALGPDLVVAKGDLTTNGAPEEYAAFEACYRPALGDRLVVMLGNHDHPAAGPVFPPKPVECLTVGGVTLVLLDTTAAGEVAGHLSAAQLDELDDALAGADGPCLVFGHHPVRDPGAADWMGEAAVLDEASSDGLVAVAARRPAMSGYFAGHTHRNRTRRLAATGDLPWVEVACTKDFPGSWAEYRVHSDGFMAVHHRIAWPEALAWSEACRSLVHGLYPTYAVGDLGDRCFVARHRKV